MWVSARTAGGRAHGARGPLVVHRYDSVLPNDDRPTLLGAHPPRTHPGPTSSLQMPAMVSRHGDLSAYLGALRLESVLATCWDVAVRACPHAAIIHEGGALHWSTSRRMQGEAVHEWDCRQDAQDAPPQRTGRRTGPRPPRLPRTARNRSYCGAYGSPIRHPGPLRRAAPALLQAAPSARRRSERRANSTRRPETPEASLEIGRLGVVATESRRARDPSRRSSCAVSAEASLGSPTRA
jgi:hypothetical protein